MKLLVNPRLDQTSPDDGFRGRKQPGFPRQLRSAFVLALWLANLLVLSDEAAAAAPAWTGTGSTLVPQAYNQISALLYNGQVLVAGGNTTHGLYLTNSQIYDPTTANWTDSGLLNAPRVGGIGLNHSTATLLPSGKVLAAGGFVYAGVTNGTLASAELWDPATGTWTLTGSMPGPRSGHTATLLPNGQVLVAGGTAGFTNLASALIYDPASGAWTTTASLASARAYHAASLLPNGKVLVMAGEDAQSYAVKTAELYDSGLSFSAAQQPQIASVIWPNAVGGVTVNGTGLGGVGQGSSGNTQGSPSVYPLVELLNLHSGQSVSLLATNGSANAVSCPPVSLLPPGYVQVTVFVNGISSAGKIVKSPSLALVNIQGNLMPPSVGSSGVTVNFAGLPGRTYTVQRAPSPAGPWSTTATVTMGGDGLGSYLDANPPVGGVFYRTTHQ